MLQFILMAKGCTITDVNNERGTALVIYPENKFNLLIIRANGEENKDIIDYVINTNNDVLNFLIVCEDTDHLIRVAKSLPNEIKPDVKLFYQPDIMAFKYPGYFSTISFCDNNYIITEIKQNCI